MKKQEKPKKLTSAEVVRIYKQILSIFPFLSKKEEHEYRRKTKGVIANKRALNEEPVEVLKKLLLFLKNPHAAVRVLKKGGKPKRAAFTTSFKKGILFIQIPSWSVPKNVSKQLKKVCADKKGKFDAVVIDVRGNGGGNSSIAHDFASIFFKDDVVFGTVVTRGGKKLRRDDFTLKGGGKRFLDVPMVIVIDKWCFSSNELFLAPFKVTKRATLVGQTTAGGSANPKMFFVSLGDQTYRVQVPRWRFFLKGKKLPIEKTKIRPDVTARGKNAEKTAFSIARKASRYSYPPGRRS